MRPPCFKAHQEKNVNFATKFQYPGSHSWYVPTFPRNFQTDIGSLDLSSRENVMEQMLECWFTFPCECGDIHYGFIRREKCK